MFRRDAWQHRGRRRIEQDVGHALPQAHPPLPAVVEQRGCLERGVTGVYGADPVKDRHAVLLVAEHHRLEQAALAVVEDGVGFAAVGVIDVRVQRPEELVRPVPRARASSRRP